MYLKSACLQSSDSVLLCKSPWLNKPLPGKVAVSFWHSLHSNQNNRNTRLTEKEMRDGENAEHTSFTENKDGVVFYSVLQFVLSSSQTIQSLPRALSSLVFPLIHFHSQAESPDWDTRNFKPAGNAAAIVCCLTGQWRFFCPEGFQFCF